ncbi:MAG: iron ABC transporter substrate-binding protein [Firmicutes bacterium]|nr:iron ABC transporter substrate-binding protein [Bacillota bacterium]
MKSKPFAFLLVGIMMFTICLAGCGQPGEQAGQSETGAEQGDTGEPQEKILQLTDMEGREIIIEGEVERVVAVGSALRLYTYVNGIDRLVGVERAQQLVESGRPYIMANPELAELPLVGEGHPADPDPELLYAVEPDVIIAGDIMDREQIERIEDQIGVPVVMITCGTDVVFDSNMYESLRIIGRLVDREERAEEIIEYMESCREELANLTAAIPEEQKPSVYVGGLSHRGQHGIESTAANSPLLSAINARNVADELDVSGTIMIDKEQILQWDPDVLIIDQNGLSIVQEDYKKNPSFYKALTAVKNDRVYGQLPYVSYYNNIETALADIYYVGKVLYPEQFADIDPVEKADEIYSFFLGQPLYETMAELFGGFKQIELQ